MFRAQWCLFLTVGVLFAGCAKVVVVKVPTTASADGIIYALPNTVVRVQVKVDRTEKSGARYATYAAIFAPESKPICKDQKCTEEKKVTYSLQQNATFATYGEPDPENVFLVKFSGKGAIDQTMSMTWNEAGLASGVGSSVTNRTTDVVMSSLKLLAGLGTKAALGAFDATAGSEKCSDDSTTNDRWVIRILQDNGGESSAALIANYCSIDKTEREKLPHEETLLKNAARSYVDRVQPLAKGRASILSAASPTMEPATLLPRIETEIDHQLSALYLGTKKTQTWDGAIDVRIIAVDAPLAVLRIDSEKGICVTGSEVPPESKAIPPEFALLSDEECRKASAINLTLRYHPDRNQQLFTKITDVSNGDRSFRYRIPAQVSAKLSNTEKTFGAGSFWVAQLGTVISLPADRHSKGLSYDLAFVEATGGLKTFKLGTTGGLDSATVDALSNVGGTLVDYRNSIRKNENELSVLTREDQLLKLRDDICTIQKKYGLTCTVEPQ